MNKIKIVSRMIPSWFLLSLGILAAALALYEDNMYVRVIACLVTIFTIVVQFLQSQAYVYEIKQDKWFDRCNGEFGLTIPASFHAKGSVPQINIYEKQPNGMYSEIECDVRTSPDDNVIIVASQAFDGQAKIR